MDLVKILFGRAPFYPQIRNFQHLVEAIVAVVKYGYPARDLTVIGVTGTDGKTTVVNLIGAILQEAGFKVAIISSINAYIGDKTIDTGFHVTTPDAGDLQRLLKQAKNSAVTHVVLETTSHGLDQHRVFGCNFKYGVLTNIAHEHLDYHKTFERYQIAKAKLFRRVKVAVLNSDDPSYELIQKFAGRAKIISYGLTKQATIVGKNVNLDIRGTRFLIREEKSEVNIITPLLGEFNVLNILAAAGLARTLGINWDDITRAIANFKGLPGRLERIKNTSGLTIFVDFAHTPNALAELLKLMQKIKPKGAKMIVVFGSAGERDKAKRKLMGEIAVGFADFSVLTAEDPRTENVEDIIDQITRGIRQNAKVWDGQTDWRKSGRWFIRVPERGEAIAFAIQKLAQKDDIVLLCGKGHEKSMAYGKKEYPWSDQEAVQAALNGRVKRVSVTVTKPVS